MMYVDTSTYSVEGSVNHDLCTTPLTPSSTFTTSFLQNNQNIINTVLLCYWDNILGPRIRHSWQINNERPLANSTAVYICLKTLSGEVCRDASVTSVDFKLYSVPDKRLLVLALIFSTAETCGLGVNALLVVMAPEQRAQYLQKHDLMLHWFERIITKLKVYLNKDTIQNTLILFSGDLHNLFNMMTALHEDGLPPTIPLTSTALSANHTLDEEFLRRALASHIITMGRSVVVGKTTDKINIMISTLALFNSESERVCSHYVNLNPDKAYSYHHDVWLQGLTKGPTNVLTTLTTEILSSHYPTTIIDLENREIFQSMACPDHFLWRRHTSVSEVTALYMNDVEKLTFPKGMFFTFDYAETIVQSCLSDLSLLEYGCGVRESYIDHFNMSLKRQALALIKYLEAETDRGANPARINPRKLKQDLGLTQEGNFRIVMAVAEKLKPGLYSFLLGERKEGDPLQTPDESLRLTYTI